MLITAAVIVSGFLFPIEPAQAFQPLTTTECHYEFNGTLLNELYTEYDAEASCPAFPPHSQLVEVAVRSGVSRDDANDPNVDCRIIRIVYTEY